MDRIDLQVEVNQPHKEELQERTLGESSRAVAERVQLARNRQTERFQNEKNIFTNSDMNLKLVEKYCQLDEGGEKLLSQAVDKFSLSARSYVRLLKIARTIADLAESDTIQVNHVAESLQYRGRSI
jgi:magnesium chelatase family protein